MKALRLPVRTICAFFHIPKGLESMDGPPTGRRQLEGGHDYKSAQVHDLEG